MFFLLTGQALLDVNCDHTVNPNPRLVSVLYAAGPSWSGDCMLALIQETDQVSYSCSHAQLTRFRTHAGLAVHATNKTIRLLPKALYT